MEHRKENIPNLKQPGDDENPLLCIKRKNR